MTLELFFCIALDCSFIWYHCVPSYLLTAPSVFNKVSWIAPNNFTVNTLFGTNIGMGIFTFDGLMIVFIDSPLITLVSLEISLPLSYR